VANNYSNHNGNQEIKNNAELVNGESQRNSRIATELKTENGAHNKLKTEHKTENGAHNKLKTEHKTENGAH
jgi:hypothetical protein